MELSKVGIALDLKSRGPGFDSHEWDFLCPFILYFFEVYVPHLYKKNKRINKS